MVANCLTPTQEVNDCEDDNDKNLGQVKVPKHVRGNPPSYRDISQTSKSSVPWNNEGGSQEGSSRNQ